MPKLQEVNFDTIVGPLHNYSGLSAGNLASTAHKGSASYPKQAALQGLAKMQLLHSLGLAQGMLPPQSRPDFAFLQSLGFAGTKQEILQQVTQADSILLQYASSSSFMWAANAATVISSFDSLDDKTHIVVANLPTMLHRTIEADSTYQLLQKIFAKREFFKVHAPLLRHTLISDEGSANYLRLYNRAGEVAHVFVYGRCQDEHAIGEYPFRQSLLASQSVARLSQLDLERVLFIQQNPAAIRQGVFHNDVICVGNAHVVLYHEDAFLKPNLFQDQVQNLLGKDCLLIKITNDKLTVKDAVATYLFNSQLVSLPDNSMALIAPLAVKEHRAARSVVDEIVADRNNPINQLHFVDLSESLRNGGGPACTRLRVPLQEKELAAIAPQFLYSEKMHAKLAAVIDKYYPEQLTLEDLSDVNVLQRTQEACARIYAVFGLDV